MWCVHKGQIAIMVQDAMRRDRNGYRWVYIPEARWLGMTEAEKARYIV